MTDYREINRTLKNNVNMNNLRETSTKLYLIRPSFIFQEEPLLDIIYSIYKDISKYFDIPISSIYITGSAHLGFSLKDDHDFSCDSDLDIAIIDSNLFNKYLNKILSESNGYTRNDGFFRNEIHDNLYSYKKNICKGKIHPLYFPNGNTKIEWRHFFDKISREYSKYFKNITGCIYLSEECFQLSQEDSLNKFSITNGVTI